jgi:hypothetical protein
METLLRRILRHPLLSEQGVGIVEPLVLTLLLMVVLGSTALMFNSINRRMISTQQQVVMQAQIDDDLRQIKTLARRFTCCSGVCTTTIPSTFGVVSGITQPCATNNPLDDRYYFPQVDLATTTTNFTNTSTSSEPLAVAQLCANNANFMTPFRAAVDAVALPTGTAWSRNTAILPERILQVTFTDNNNADRVIRVQNIIPHMAYYCP